VKAVFKVTIDVKEDEDLQIVREDIEYILEEDFPDVLVERVQS
jgi:hypothetical protein